MKILHLTLKKKWFDMILSGEKQDEYREIKPYWTKRLTGKKHTHIQFTNGYGKNRPSFIIEYVELWQGYGLTRWGAPGIRKVYILSLGKIVNTL